MNNTPVVVKQSAPPFLIRVLYFIFIGWWLTGLWINVAWVLNATIIGLPLGLLMINRVPQVLTLKPMKQAVTAHVDKNGHLVNIRTTGLPQHHWLLRLIYFLIVGWWVSFLWANVAWILCITIIGLPFGIMMFNMLPAVTTLMRT